MERRNFIKNSGLLVGSVALSPHFNKEKNIKQQVSPKLIFQSQYFGHPIDKDGAVLLKPATEITEEQILWLATNVLCLEDAKINIKQRHPEHYIQVSGTHIWTVRNEDRKMIKYYEFWYCKYDGNIIIYNKRGQGVEDVQCYLPSADRILRQWGYLTTFSCFDKENNYQFIFPPESIENGWAKYITT